MSSAVIDRLRNATADLHHALDSAVDPVRRLHARADRIALLDRYFALHAAAEASIESQLAGHPTLSLEQRRRAPLIADDLRALGAAVPLAPPPLPLASPAEALGVLYVMEGSTLGGRMILRQLQANGADPTGLGFLDPYGPRTGPMWRTVLDTLQTELGSDAHAVEQAVLGARQGFAHARACLCDDFSRATTEPRC